MASPPPPAGPIGPDTLITVKVVIDGNNRRFKLALRDLGAHVLPQKLRFLLAIKPDTDVKFERFSDSAGTYVTLDSNNPSIYKQLYRAAKAKLKLRLRVTVNNKETPTAAATQHLLDELPAVNSSQAPAAPPFPTHAEARQSYLETVLSRPAPMSHQAPLPSAMVAGHQHFGPSPTANTLFAANNANAAAQTPAAQAKTPTKFDPSRPTVPCLHDFPNIAFAIDCNSCGKAIPNEHYHCSSCDSGDFDLCQECVDMGMSCDDDEHWLIKRFQRAGTIIPSCTETLAPKKAKTEPVPAPAAKEVKPQEVVTTFYKGERTCNSCITELPGEEFMTCEHCADFDLCFCCFLAGEHGHHPAHAFRAVGEDTDLSADIAALAGAGRGVKHQAICDGCDQQIHGVRHKCLTCPDWDFCATCVLSADQIHPGHRFVPLYEPIAAVATSSETHFGIYCDGPLCAARRRKSYIRGDRYKCAVCHDTDFCANCEAVPTATHNQTHPLIKFKTPVRHVSVTTLGEHNDGRRISQMGDRTCLRHASTETTPPASSTNAATQVQTIAEVKPAEMLVSTTPKADPIDKCRSATTDLQAWFESDSTPDGSRFGPNRLVSQSWTLRNPGPHAWPAGCAVYFIGGDDMRNVDAKHPSSVTDMGAASRSNILPESLAPGKTAVFEVLLKSPPHDGRVISYWRLKTPEGVPFGHKLWVDITVAATPAAELLEKSVVRPELINDERTPTASVKADDVKAEHETNEEIDSQASSTMIFPKLEKESPMSSVHDVTAAPQPTVEPTTTTAEQELLEDVESLELEDEETDDGFMTDEEYDILDASDEDYLLEAQNAMAAKK